MIKLELPTKPLKLTQEVQNELTAQFINKGTDVWNKPFIREAVMQIAFSKCCYSECKLGEDSKYMEIDHFYSKKDFPEKVVEWGNLLPTCKKCNTTKGAHNVVNEPIINPCFDNPKEHLYIQNFRFYGKSAKGKTTIDVVALNDRKQFVNVRYKIGTEILENLDDIKQNIVEQIDDIQSDIRKRNRFLTRLKKLLGEGTRENEYSATISTIILQNDDYIELESVLKHNSLWDNDLEILKNELTYCSLPK